MLTPKTSGEGARYASMSRRSTILWYPVIGLGRIRDMFAVERDTTLWWEAGDEIPGVVI